MAHHRKGHAGYQVWYIMEALSLMQSRLPASASHRRKRTRLRGERFAALTIAAGLLLACSRSEQRTSGPMTKMQADRTVQRAIRSSNEGVILMPSKKAEQVYELPRLNEIAQNLRGPAAVCFLEQALQQMEADPSSDQGFANIPDGQVKLRARINPGGKVLATEIMESGFDEDTVPLCVAQAVKRQRWPENTGGTNHYIDIVYWVSLGLQPQRASQQFADRLRREQAQAAVRAKACLRGRVEPGSYTVEGLNLIGADGATIANRIDQTAMPGPVRQCLAQAFKQIRIPAESESFLRPVSPQVRFDVDPDGTVRAADEDWLRLVQLEERAKKAEVRRELTGQADGDSTASAPNATVRPMPGGDAAQADVPPAVTLSSQGQTKGDSAGQGSTASIVADEPQTSPAPPQADPPSVAEPEQPSGQAPLDPQTGGIKLNLSGRGTKER